MGMLGNTFRGAMYALDTPGAMSRAGLANMADYFSGEDRFQGWRATGREMLGSMGMSAEDQPGFDARDAAGLAADMIVDPLNLIGLGLWSKFGKAAKATDLAGDIGTMGKATAEFSDLALKAPLAGMAMSKASKPMIAASIASPVAGAALMMENEQRQDPLVNAIGMGMMAAPLLLGGVMGAKKLMGGKKAPALQTDTPVKRYEVYDSGKPHVDNNIAFVSTLQEAKEMASKDPAYKFADRLGDKPRFPSGEPMFLDTQTSRVAGSVDSDLLNKRFVEIDGEIRRLQQERGLRGSVSSGVIDTEVSLLFKEQDSIRRQLLKPRGESAPALQTDTPAVQMSADATTPKVKDVGRVPVQGDTLQEAMAGLNLSDDQAALWKELEPILGKQTKGMPGFKVGDFEPPQRVPAAGMYESQPHLVRMHPTRSAGMEAEVLLHESLHAATRDAVLMYEAPYYHGSRAANVPKLSRDAYSRLEAIGRYAEDALNEMGEESLVLLPGSRGLKNMRNPAELISYTFTNKTTRDFLSTIKVPGSTKHAALRGKNLLQAFMDFVKDMLGIKSKRAVTALEEVMGLTSTIAAGDIKAAPVSAIKSLSPWAVGLGSYGAAKGLYSPEREPQIGA